MRNSTFQHSDFTQLLALLEISVSGLKIENINILKAENEKTLPEMIKDERAKSSSTATSNSYAEKT